MLLESLGAVRVVVVVFLAAGKGERASGSRHTSSNQILKMRSIVSGGSERMVSFP